MSSWIGLFKEKPEGEHSDEITDIKMAKAFAPSPSSKYMANGTPLAHENGRSGSNGVLKPIVNVDDKLPNGKRNSEETTHLNNVGEKRENGVGADEGKAGKDANEKESCNSSAESDENLHKTEYNSEKSVEQGSEDETQPKKPPRAWAVLESTHGNNDASGSKAIGGESQWPTLADSKSMPPKPSNTTGGSVPENGNGNANGSGTTNLVKNGNWRVNTAVQVSGMNPSSTEEGVSATANTNGLSKAAGKKGRGGWRKLENHNLVVADTRSRNHGTKIGWSSAPVSPQAEEGGKVQLEQVVRETIRPAGVMRGKNGTRQNLRTGGGRGRSRDGFNGSPRTNGENGPHSRGGYTPRAGNAYHRNTNHEKYAHNRRSVYKSRSTGSGMSYYPNESQIGTGMYYGHLSNDLMTSQDDSRLFSVSRPTSHASSMYPPNAVYHAEMQSSLILTYLQMQIEYYFSVENLCRDVFLRSQMDSEGYVKLELIRQFNRIKFYSPEKSHMIRCLKNSQVVETRGDKIRRKGDWMRWVLHPKEDHTPNHDRNETGDLNDVLVLVRSSDDGNDDGKSADDLQPKPTDRISFSWQSMPPQKTDPSTHSLPYTQFRNKCLASETANAIVDLHNFWMQYLSVHWNKAIYDQFKSSAEDRALGGKYDGLKYLLGFYSNRLESGPDETLEKDFINIVTKFNSPGNDSDFTEFALNKLLTLRGVIKAQGRGDFDKIPPEIESALAAKNKKVLV